MEKFSDLLPDIQFFQSYLHHIRLYSNLQLICQWSVSSSSTMHASTMSDLECLFFLLICWEMTNHIVGFTLDFVERWQISLCYKFSWVMTICRETMSDALLMMLSGEHRKCDYIELIARFQTWNFIRKSYLVPQDRWYF